MRTISGCLDLGISTPGGYPAVAKMLSDREFDFVVLMEDRQPDFFLTYDGFNPDSYTRLNRHGPYRSSHPTQRDLCSFVEHIQDAGVKVLYGFWPHENRWVSRRHPEILLTDSAGSIWHTADYSADFNPLLEFELDDDYYGIQRGDRFADFACKQYDRLSSDFGFDGLFVGDGGMGFRVFGNDSIGVNRYDYSKQSLARFTQSQFFCSHGDGSSCLLDMGKEGYAPSRLSNDILKFHARGFTEWNCEEWTGFYKILAKHLCAERNGLLAAYSCMNYGADVARLHGVDYKSIAAAGLDYLVFQTYAYAWGQHFRLQGKDIAINLENLASVLREVDSMSGTQVLFTAEMGDDVEGWKCPMGLSLEQVRTYCNPNRTHANSRAPDGLFLVWLNKADPDDISAIVSEFDSPNPSCK